MTPEEKAELITRNSAEVIGNERILSLIGGKKPVVYCGYETSGEVHLGHLVTITKLLDLQKAGCEVIVLFADWHTWLNRKGDWDFIHEQTKHWEKAFKAAGLEKARYVLGSTFQRTPGYMDDVMALALATTMNRALRSMQEVARDIEHAHVSQVLYPLMQIADMKHLKVDMATAGLEQRKIHMLGQESLSAINYPAPVFIHTPLIPSLKGPETKMSSSVPESLISVRDSAEDIKKKMNKAYCPEGITENNPIILMAELLIFPRMKTFVIDRPEKFGGKVRFDNIAELKTAYESKRLFPLDLKNAVAEEMIKILEPIRKAFQK